KAMDELERQRTLLKADVVHQREADLQGKIKQLQETYLRLQKELSEKEATMMKPILERVNGVIGQIAQQESFTIVFEKTQSSILWANPHLDPPKEVIGRYNSGGGGAAKAPAKTSKN